MARLMCQFGVIKFIPNSIKQEVINIAVLVHSPQQRIVKAKFLDYEPRIRHFVTDIQYAEFRSFRRMFNKHVRSLAGKIVDPLIEVRLDDDHYLEKLQQKLTAPFVVSTPQYVFSDNLDQQIEDLYQNVILDPDECRIKQKSFVKQIEEHFFRAGLESYIKRDIEVKSLPFVHIEFGYQRNESLDLVQPIVLQDSPRENYKEGMFWTDAIRRVQDDHSLKSGEFVAVIKPPRKSKASGTQELVHQLRQIEGCTIVNYRSDDFLHLIENIKRFGTVTRA